MIHVIPPCVLSDLLVAPHADVRQPVPAGPSQPERIDYEYERLGTANLFFMVEPRAGLAPCGDDGAAHQARLRRVFALVGRYGLS